MFKNPKANKKLFFILSTVYCLLSTILSGCVTVPARGLLPAFNINGTTYLPLISLCEQKQITWEYDTFTKTIDLNNQLHKLKLRVGDTLVMIDGKAEYLQHPVDIYQGTIVVPAKFKEQILDRLSGKTAATAKKPPAAWKIRKVVIDAGHGGNDPGAVGKSGLKEKDVNLDIVRRLAKLLREDGVEITMTRSTDIFIPLLQRAKIANDAQADLFISIHSNANRVRSLNGFEVYYISPNVGDLRRALSTAENSGSNLDNKNCLSSSLNLKTTLWDMIYTYNRAEAIKLAADICKVIDTDLNTRVIGVKYAAFQVLKETQMPAILIETGFLSNANEERLLKNSSYRQQIAEAIERGIAHYTKEYAMERD
ncbi:MAG: N-acetylmuramoyl-L-alanine amidase [Candidatus Omnitrophota bacterium]